MSAGAVYQLESKMFESYGAPTNNPCGQDAQSIITSIDPFQPHQCRDYGHQSFHPSWQAVHSTLPDAQPLWRVPDYSSQPDSEGCAKEETATVWPDYYVGSNPKNLTCSGFSRMRMMDFLSSETEAVQSAHVGVQRGCPDEPDVGWGLSPLTTSNQESLHHSDGRSARSPSSQAPTPSPPGGPAWLSVADSAYGSLPSSRHGSGSGQADAMKHAGHYFAIAEEEASPRTTGQAPFLAGAGTGAEKEASPDVREVSTTKAGHTEQNQRSRQDAHSKVEKRYRMNINNKIEQLRRILPIGSSSEHQCLSQIGTSCNPRRRKSGAELSKGDILSLAISNVQQLQNEVQQLASQNMELREKLALMRSLAGDD